MDQQEFGFSLDEASNSPQFTQPQGSETETAALLLSGYWSLKNPPAMQEMRVRSLGQENSLEEEMATHSSTCLENPVGRGA